MIILLYTSNVMEEGKKLNTCTGTTVQNLSVVLTVNCMTITKHETIAIHTCIDAPKIQNDG